MPNTLQDLLSHLDGVVERGNGYKAICPCHPDHKPSLDIYLSDEGNLLIVCRACNAAVACGAATFNKGPTHVKLGQLACYRHSDVRGCVEERMVDRDT